MKTTNEKLDHYRHRGQEVLVDFDGTLCEFNYPKLGAPRPGALAFIKWLVEQDLRPIIWSSRMSLDNGNLDEVYLQRWSIMQWLEDNGFPRLEVDGGRAGKRLALAYVDDRGVAADDDNDWASVKTRIMTIKQREDARWREHDATVR